MRRTFSTIEAAGQGRNGRRSGCALPAGGRGSDGSGQAGACGGGGREPVGGDVVGDVNAEPDPADVLREVDLVVLVDRKAAVM